MTRSDQLPLYRTTRSASWRRSMRVSPAFPCADRDSSTSSPGTSPAPRRARKAREVPHPALDAVPSFFERVSRTTPVASSPSLPPLPSFQTYYTPPRLPQGETGSGSVAVLHHGGGEGALGWAAMAKEVRSYSSGELGVLAFDCRGHGESLQSYRTKRKPCSLTFRRAQATRPTQRTLGTRWISASRLSRPISSPFFRPSSLIPRRRRRSWCALQSSVALLECLADADGPAPDGRTLDGCGSCSRVHSSTSGPRVQGLGRGRS